MSFMQQEIFETDWIEIGTTHGTYFVPADYLSYVVDYLKDESIEDVLEMDAVRRDLLQYTEAYKPEHILSVELRHGFGTRMSAPGYLDCTEWSVFDTEAEAAAYLEEYYGDEDEDGDED
jgi:squalene cyclase